jgi:hypothetical protein
MCDYSLEHVASRPAKVGDKLVSTSFGNSATRGFAAVGEPNVAVCLLPGTEIAFDKDVTCDDSYGLYTRKLRQKLARFREIDVDKPHTHHDALEFPDGLCDGDALEPGAACNRVAASRQAPHGEDDRTARRHGCGSQKRDHRLT